jgi:hypothetical protein
MAEHKHGTMDASTHEANFAGFVKFATRVATICIVALVLLALING